MEIALLWLCFFLPENTVSKSSCRPMNSQSQNPIPAKSNGYGDAAVTLGSWRGSIPKSRGVFYPTWTKKHLPFLVVKRCFFPKQKSNLFWLLNPRSRWVMSIIIIPCLWELDFVVFGHSYSCAYICLYYSLATYDMGIIIRLIKWE